LVIIAILKPVDEVADGARKRCGQTRELVLFAPPEICICPLWGRIPAGISFGECGNDHDAAGNLSGGSARRNRRASSSKMMVRRPTLRAVKRP
jgi:hypothetical protein